MNSFTTWDGHVIDLEDDRELAETCLPFGLVEVLQEFAAAGRLRTKRERFPDSFQILDKAAEWQRWEERKADPARYAAARARTAAWKSTRRKELCEAEKRRRQADPELFRAKAAERYQRKKADPLFRQQRAEAQRRYRATPEGRARAAALALAAYYRRKAKQAEAQP